MWKAADMSLRHQRGAGRRLSIPQRQACNQHVDWMPLTATSVMFHVSYYGSIDGAEKLPGYKDILLNGPQLLESLNPPRQPAPSAPGQWLQLPCGEHWVGPRSCAARGCCWRDRRGYRVDGNRLVDVRASPSGRSRLAQSGMLGIRK